MLKGSSAQSNEIDDWVKDIKQSLQSHSEASSLRYNFNFTTDTPIGDADSRYQWDRPKSHLLTEDKTKLVSSAKI